MDRGVDVRVGMGTEVARRPQEGEDVEPAGAEETSAGEASAGIRTWRLAAGVAALYLGIRALGLLLLNTMIHHGGTTRYVNTEGLVEALRNWDAVFYLRLADYGYDNPQMSAPYGGPAIRSAAFLPGYPATVHVVAGLTHLSTMNAALLVTGVAGVVAACSLFFLVRGLHGARVALITVVLWAAHPASIVLSSAYSEALFCALAFSALLAVYRQRWLLGGLLAFGAGLVRAQGLALGGGLALYAAWTWWRGRGGEAGAGAGGNTPGAVGRVRPLWMLAGSALALLGTPTYMVGIGIHVGNIYTWFDQQRLGWQSQWTWGSETRRQAWYEFSGDGHFFAVTCMILLAAAVVLLVCAADQREWPALLLVGVLIAVETLGSSVVTQSKPRLLVPAVVVFLPIARALASARPVSRWLVLSCLALFGLWLGDYSVTVWTYGI